jgi:phospholipase C
LASLCLLVAACSSKAPLAGPAEWNRKVTPPDDSVAATQRTACGYQAGSLPSETQGKSAPYGSDIPVDHVIVMMMENRSFDHYFQKLPAHGWNDVEVAPDTFMNLDNSGQPVVPKRDSNFCFVDTAHGWSAVHAQINGGKMDGFFSTNDQDHDSSVMGASMDMVSGARGLTYYDQDDLPVAYWIADKFAIADHYHSSIPGPTWPNRMYLYGATSRGKIGNTVVTDDMNTLFDELEKRKITWTIYYTRTPGFAVFAERFTYYFSGEGSYTDPPHTKKIAEFFTDAAAGKLPQVVFVDPDIGHEGVGANDEHPPAVMQVGQKLIGQVVDAVVKSPTWKSTAMFLTYDEHGGLYDHVVPPPACVPDDVAPELGTETPGTFDQYGVRVPMMILSPYAKAHYVGHKLYDHTSISRFIEARFEMPAMTRRDANAEAPWDMFDFAHRRDEAFGSPPEVTVDQDKLNGCLAIFGPGGQ